MTELTIIKTAEILNDQVFNVYGTVEEPLFLAKDVANLLGERDGAAATRKVDEEEKLLHTICVAGQNRNVLTLTEDGLYECLMQSRKPVARQFKKEVKAILKQIRITGGYIPVQKEDSPAELMARALLVAQSTLDQKDKLIENQQKTIEVQAPKVAYVDEVLSTENCFTTSVIAQDLGTTAIMLNRLLEMRGVQYKQSGIWNLRSKYVRSGYARISTYVDKDKVSRHNLKWTEKGRKFVVGIYRELQTSIR